MREVKKQSLFHQLRKKLKAIGGQKSAFYPLASLGVIGEPI